ncbi:MAG: adenosylmethionine--8-amino-7-oxononanoate transaminase [Bacteroidota bacterium]
MTLSGKDKRYIWHPYTQHKTAGEAIPIVKGEKAWLYDEAGNRYIDAISSWWTNIHGHAHPYIAEKVHEQFLTLEHVIFAGFTHEQAVRLAGRLLERLPPSQKKVFFSDNGSTAVEVALKMAFQYWHNRGEERKKVIAFRNAYHGDTFGAMSVSGRGAFTGPFESLLFDVVDIDAPVSGKESASLEELRRAVKDPGIACFIFEPLVQGTAGMVMHSGDALSEMIAACRKEQVLTIADEVMTGFGRTGTFFASDRLANKADMYCLSKGLTGGAMPLGITACTDEVYQAFLSDDKMRTFFHGHSYTANPLACAAANASLDLFEKEGVMKEVERIGKMHRAFRESIAGHPALKDARCLGSIMALEIQAGSGTSYFNALRDTAYAYFIEKGILIRPLGNIIYLMPPYCISDDDLDYIYRSIKEFLDAVQG